MLVFYVVLVAVLVAGTVFLKPKWSLNVTALAATMVVSLLAPWGVYSITEAIAKDSDQTFYEFWNGSENSVTTKVVTCEKNGSCRHKYDCDPHQETEVETYTDEKGNIKTRVVTKTVYDSCPYSKEETDFLINTTLGVFSAGDNLMTGEKYRGNKEIPGGRQQAPQIWIDAKNRIESGNPSGVTQLHKYKNFILAADTTLFKEYSDKIDSLLGEGLLPTPASSVQALYMANKAYNVGDTKLDMNSMNKQLQQLNALVGAELRGDMHIVFVEAAKAGDPTDYTNALKAYWSSEEVGKNAIAKNTLTLVVGVKQKDNAPVVEWAKGYTGMPVGNESLIQEFSNLKGKTIDNNFIGSPVFNPVTGAYTKSNGAVENMVTGPNKFARVSMSASDANDTGSGFKYLEDSWHMKESDVTKAIIISSIVSLLLLGLGGFLSIALADSADPLRKFAFSSKKK